jgi:hypothetical protein
MINEVCDIVRSEQFSADLATLGLRPETLEASTDGASGVDYSKTSKSKYTQVSYHLFSPAKRIENKTKRTSILSKLNIFALLVVKLVTP